MPGLKKKMCPVLAGRRQADNMKAYAFHLIVVNEYMNRVIPEMRKLNTVKCNSQTRRRFCYSFRDPYIHFAFCGRYTHSIRIDYLYPGPLNSLLSYICTKLHYQVHLTMPTRDFRGANCIKPDAKRIYFCCVFSVVTEEREIDFHVCVFSLVLLRVTRILGFTMAGVSIWALKTVVWSAISFPPCSASTTTCLVARNGERRAGSPFACAIIYHKEPIAGSILDRSFCKFVISS